MNWKFIICPLLLVFFSAQVVGQTFEEELKASENKKSLRKYILKNEKEPTLLSATISNSLEYNCWRTNRYSCQEVKSPLKCVLSHKVHYSETPYIFIIPESEEFEFYSQAYKHYKKTKRRFTDKWFQQTFLGIPADIFEQIRFNEALAASDCYKLRVFIRDFPHSTNTNLAKQTWKQRLLAESCVNINDFMESYPEEKQELINFEVEKFITSTVNPGHTAKFLRAIEYSQNIELIHKYETFAKEAGDLYMYKLLYNNLESPEHRQSTLSKAFDLATQQFSGGNKKSLKTFSSYFNGHFENEIKQLNGKHSQNLIENAALLVDSEHLEIRRFKDWKTSAVKMWNGNDNENTRVYYTSLIIKLEDSSTRKYSVVLKPGGDMMVFPYEESFKPNHNNQFNCSFDFKSEVIFSICKCINNNSCIEYTGYGLTNERTGSVELPGNVFPIYEYSKWRGSYLPRYASKYIPASDLPSSTALGFKSIAEKDAFVKKVMQFYFEH